MDDGLKAQIARLRPGDVVTVDELRNLAGTLRELREVLNEIHAKGAAVEETNTGRRSDTVDAADMVIDAAVELKKGPPASVSRESGKKGGRPPIERETPRDVAEKHWFDMRHRTDKDALEHMPGWNASAAYREFKASGRPRRGRPVKKPR